jgi:hypothetical protein
MTERPPTIKEALIVWFSVMGGIAGVLVSIALVLAWSKGCSL